MSLHLAFRAFPDPIPASFPPVSLTGPLFSPNWPSCHSLDKRSASLTAPSAFSYALLSNVEMPLNHYLSQLFPATFPDSPLPDPHYLPTPSLVVPHSTELVPLVSTSMLCLFSSPTRFSLSWMKEPSISHRCVTASVLSSKHPPPWHGVGAL